MSDATDVLCAIDQLRRDLSGYHGQLKAHNDLQRHCDNQRKRIAELEGLYAKAKAEKDETAMAFSKEYDRAEFLMKANAKLRELVRDVVLLAGIAGCDVTNMQLHTHSGDWRTIWERMSELGVPGTEV